MQKVGSIPLQIPCTNEITRKSWKGDGRVKRRFVISMRKYCTVLFAVCENVRLTSLRKHHYNKTVCVYVTCTFISFNCKMFLSLFHQIFPTKNFRTETTISSASSTRSGLDNTVFRTAIRAVGYSNAII